MRRAVQQQGVGKRNGRVAQALAGGGSKGDESQRLIHLVVADGVNLAVTYALRQVVGIGLDDGVPPVIHGQVAHLVPVVPGQPALHSTVVHVVAQLGTQRMGMGQCAVDHAHAHITFAVVGVKRLVQPNQAQALARQHAHADVDVTPELAPFPVAVIGGVVAKAQKNGQRQTNQRKGNGGDGDLDIEEITVSQRDQHGQQDVQAQFPADAL